MFIDRAVIFVKSGNGGHGAVAFHREKYVAAGGPDGGDGGKGGSVIFKVDTGMTTLADFRYKRKYVAENGQNGSNNKKTGKNGADIIIKVPQGTIIKDNKTGKKLADLVEADAESTIVRGGKGGKGNCHFATSTRQIPNFAIGGEAGLEMEVVLELKLLADVGLAGFPNVGKSTLLSVTTGAKPEIANYHFTTINPHLGVVALDEGNSFVLADIPGLIEGASEGVGLGHRFLRHIERTRLIIHVIDVSGCEGRDPFEDFLLINSELEKYNAGLAKRPQIIAANKLDNEGAEEKLSEFKEKFNAWLEEQKADNEDFEDLIEKGAFKIFPISAACCQGTRELMLYAGSILKNFPISETFDPSEDFDEEYTFKEDGDELYTIEIDEDGVYVISGRWIERVINSVNLADSESSAYFQRLLRQKGIIDKLLEMGIQEDDPVRIADTEFDFVQ